MTTEHRAARAVEQMVLHYAREHPESGQAKAAQALKRMGYAVSASGVRYIWRKHDLETAYKRLKAIEKGEGAAGLTGGQREILRRGDAARRIARKSRRAAPEGAPAQPDARRNHILLAAAELFVKHGYAGTSVRDIARSVGLLAGSVYHYFPSKEDLFVALNREGLRQLMLRIEAALAGVSDARERLERAVTEHILTTVGDDPVARITATGLFAIHEPKLQRRLKAERERYENVFRQLVDGLGLPPGVDPSTFRLALFGAMNWTRVWYRPGKLGPHEVARQFVAIFTGTR